ncbi:MULTISPECIES: hypothetical protein [Micromonospora]|nr:MULTISPECIES: hypothetical protein [Micromonospora]NES14406.1 hypothetical protein [Micromonospora sp. PPF5-17B]NES36805.1 hypothetical protein [Micromonospora solifontis]NES56563.1 hypothetical protein [Micromonospora sp. PPF5-6]
MTPAGDVRHLLHRALTPWRVAYRAETLRRLAWSVIALPSALAALATALRRPGRIRNLARALLALPVALAGSALTGTLAFLVLINVLAYPFRPWLGIGGSTGDIWADRYADSWGGPTLAGAWATHATLILLLVVPPLAWAVRGLTALQRRLTGSAAPAVRPAPNPGTAADRMPRDADGVPARPAPTDPGAEPARRSRPSRRSRPPRGRLRRTGAVLAALGLLVAASLTAHANGIGDNLLWTPRDAASSLALAITLTPVAGLLLLRRTAWWRSAPGSR